jgi:hypothetical protein
MTGSTIRTRALRAVAFVCPYCEVDRDGQLHERRRWVGVGPIAVLPLQRLDPMVRCDTCAHWCGLAVLNIPTSHQLQVMLERALRHAVTSVIRAGHASDRSDEVERHGVGLLRNAGFIYDRFRLAEDLDGLRDADTAVHLRPLADELTLHGKQGLLHRLHGLATVEGTMRPAQRDLLVQIGVALGMSAAHINGVIAVGEQPTPER